MNKKASILMTTVSASLLSAAAQDVIVKRDGTAILSKVLEIGISEVKYKNHANPDGPTYTLSKADILSVNYENGQKDTFEDIAPQAATSTQQQQTISKDLRMGAEAKEQNAQLIATINAAKPVFEGKKEFKNKKAADVALHVFNIEEGSTLINDDVEIELKFDSYNTDNALFAVNTKNKSAKTIFLDLGNTFIVRGEEAQPYYVPSATQSTQSSSSGGGVNLGAIAGAFGIGGVLGSLAGGISVGGSSGSSSTTVEYAQRVVAIPPMSSKSLMPQFFFVSGISKYSYVDVGSYGKESWGRTLYKNLRNGDIIHWDANSPSLRLHFILSYAFEENCNTLYQLKAGLYAKESIGYHTKDMSSPDQQLSNRIKLRELPIKVVLTNKPRGVSDGSPVLDVTTLNVENISK